MQKLFEIQHILIEQVEEKPFFQGDQFSSFVASKHVCRVIGARDVGKNNSTKHLKKMQNSFVLADDIFIGSKNSIPLYLFGFLY